MKHDLIKIPASFKVKTSFDLSPRAAPGGGQKVALGSSMDYNLLVREEAILFPESETDHCSAVNLTPLMSAVGVTSLSNSL